MGRIQTSKWLMAFTEATIERYTNRPSEDAWRIAVLANPASLFHLRQPDGVEAAVEILGDMFQDREAVGMEQAQILRRRQTGVIERFATVGSHAFAVRGAAGQSSQLSVPS